MSMNRFDSAGSSDFGLRGMDAIITRTIRPPICVLKPFPLVVPAEIYEAFVAVLRDRDQRRSPAEYRERQRLPVAQRRAARRAEIEAALRDIQVRSQAREISP